VASAPGIKPTILLGALVLGLVGCPKDAPPTQRKSKQPDPFADWKPDLARFVFVDPPDAAEPRKVSGRVLCLRDPRGAGVDPAGDVDAYQGELPVSLVAAKPEDVTAVVVVYRHNEEVGSYGYSGRGYQRVVELTVIEVASEEVLGRATLRGGDPPQQVDKDQAVAYGSEVSADEVARALRQFVN
jgi:hypothetical protein